MATGKRVINKVKVTPKARPKAARKPKAAGPAQPEAAKMSGEAAAACKHCGMGDPNRDRIAEFLALSAREMAFELLQHPEEWLDWPNPQFGGRKPNDLIGTDEEVRVYDILAAYSLGMF